MLKNMGSIWLYTKILNLQFKSLTKHQKSTNLVGIFNVTVHSLSSIANSFQQIWIMVWTKSKRINRGMIYVIFNLDKKENPSLLSIKVAT